MDSWITNAQFYFTEYYIAKCKQTCDGKVDIQKCEAPFWIYQSKNDDKACWKMTIKYKMHKY